VRHALQVVTLWLVLGAIGGYASTVLAVAGARAATARAAIVKSVITSWLRRSTQRSQHHTRTGRSSAHQSTVPPVGVPHAAH
jgi:hypothetical protein